MGHTGVAGFEKRKERLSIYMLKDADLTDDKFIKLEKTGPGIDLKMASGQATLYIRNTPPPRMPDWVTFLFVNQDLPNDRILGNRSEGAVLIFRSPTAVFALSFGIGYHLINLDMVERDFGLRVTLNSVHPDRLRSLDKASYESNPLNVRSQSPRDADIFDLRIDVENELVYALTGASLEPLFGEQVTGRDALTIMPAATVHDLPKILEAAHRRYVQNPPEKFAWVNDVSRVKDVDEQTILDLELDDLLAQTPLPPNIWLGEPEIVDWESQTGYSFDRRLRTPQFPTLQLDKLIDYMAKGGLLPTCENLRHQSVHVNDVNYMSVRRWTAYRCLYAELSMDGKLYILRNGEWHIVSANFVERVDTALLKVDIDTTPLPVYAHDGEGPYNEACAHTQTNMTLFDRANIFVGGPYDKIEFCDLVRDGGDLIHVKVYRSSATLSHLFAQGCVSAETFVKHEDFRVTLNPKLPPSIRLADPIPRPDAFNFRVVYAIVTTKDLPLNLPFFAKVTLKNAVADLGALGFRVALAKIEMDEAFVKTGKFKPMGRAKSAPRRRAAQRRTRRVDIAAEGRQA